MVRQSTDDDRDEDDIVDTQNDFHRGQGRKGDQQSRQAIGRIDLEAAGGNQGPREYHLQRQIQTSSSITNGSTKKRGRQTWGTNSRSHHPPASEPDGVSPTRPLAGRQQRPTDRSRDR